MTAKQLNEQVAGLLNFNQELHGMMDTICSDGSTLPPMPDAMRKPEHLIHGCLSTTYFVAQQDEQGRLRIYGESNSSVLRGVISEMHYILDAQPAATTNADDITWHRDTGLMDHLTPQRQAAVTQMIERIRVECGR